MPQETKKKDAAEPAKAEQKGAAEEGSKKKGMLEGAEGVEAQEKALEPDAAAKKQAPS
jgi:hypothetical protein